MGNKIMFEKDSRTVKNPKQLQKNVILLYSLRKLTIEPATKKRLIQTDKD